MSREDRLPKEVRGEPIEAAAVGAEIAQALAQLLQNVTPRDAAIPVLAPVSESPEGYWRRYY